MFKISPLQDQTKAKEYTSACNASFRENAFIYVMTDLDSGSLMGICQFEINKNGGYIYDIACAPGIDDFEAMFILGRQTMNFIDQCGAHQCYAEAKESEIPLLRAIGFKDSADGYFCNMKGMFDGHCSGHKVELDQNK